MQKEIDHLERSLRHEQRKQAPSNFDFSSDSEEDGSYRCRSRTPLNKPFSYDEDYHHERRNRNSSLVGLGNDAISKALNQIFKSPFTHWIKGGRLPWRFTQPTFTMYNGKTVLVEHVSHFNHRMVVQSKNEPLMCKVFLSSLGLVAMRWFNGLRASSIDSFKELTQAFGSRFITCSRVPRPLALLVVFVHEGRRNFKNIFRQILGDVQRDRWRF